jgi:excisionase family DNA binding protein
MSSTTLDERKTYDVDEAGRLLGIGRNAAYEAVKSGQLPVIKMGRRLLVPKAALDRMLDGTSCTPSTSMKPLPA